MNFNLASIVHRPSRRPVVLRPIMTTQAQADSLAAIYRRVIEPWAAGKDRIMAAYELTLAQEPDRNTLSLHGEPILRIQTDSTGDIRAALDDIAEEIRRIVLQLTPDLRDWALRVERVHRGKWVRSILSAVDVALDTVLSADDVDETLEQVIEWNVSLVKDVSDDTRRRISNAVFSGLQSRTPPREVAKEISEAVGMSRRRALNIARDQGVKLGERLNRARQEQAGLTHFKWRHSGKKHPRPHHEARDGKTFPWEGSGIPKDDMPGIPPYCGCTAQGWISFDEPDEPTA